MVNVVLIVTALIFAMLIILASVYFVIYFQHPNDTWTAWYPKIIVVLGLSVSAFNIFILPLDVANQAGKIYDPDNIVPMGSITLAFHITTVLMVLVIVPFTVFWYEGLDDDDDPDGKSSIKKQFLYAMKWVLPLNVVIITIILLLYFFYGSALIPVTRITSGLNDRRSITSYAEYCNPLGPDSPCTKSFWTVEVNVSPLVYIVALVAFAGAIIFAIFGGIGMISIPVDLIQGYIQRPKPISTTEYEERKKIIGEYAQTLHDAGNQIMEELRGNKQGGTSRRQRNLRRKQNEFRRDVLILEVQYQRLEDSYKRSGGNALLQLVKLMVGVLSIFVGVAWFLHMVLYTIPMTILGVYFHLFLNEFLESMKGVPFIGPAFYAMFSFYLLFCVIRGITKVGMKIFFVSIHPMNVGDTMMNSLVFNSGVILMASIAVAQYCTTSFSYFARYTASQSIFGVQAQNLQGLKHGYMGVVCALPAFALLNGLYQIYSPYRKQKENKMSFKNFK